MGKSKTRMTESPGTKRKSAARLPEALLSKIRQLDENLIQLVQERARLVVEAARQDPSQAEALCAPMLDDESHGQPAPAADEAALPQACVQALLREVASGCRRLVREPRIAFLGPLYSFSHLAAIHRFGQSVQLVPVGSIAAVFEEVHRKQSDFGLAPIENSTDGRVADTLDMFTRMRVRICGEVELRIHHSLLGKCQRTDVREVYSKPAGTVAVPQLAGKTSALGPNHRSDQHVGRPRSWLPRSPARQPSPACKPACATGSTFWRKTSRTTPSTRRDSR